MKIAINRCWGGFSVTKAVYEVLGLEWDKYGYIDNEMLNISEHFNHLIYRADSRFIAAIEKIGVKDASGLNAEIKIREIPDGVDWYIDEGDGMETIHEFHRIW